MALHRCSLSVIIAAAFTSINASAAAQCPVVHDLNGGVDDYVYAMIEYNGDLIAGGDFTSAGGQALAHLARWDGQNWHSMNSMFNTVRHMFVYKGDLIVSNGGNQFGRWNGTSWTMYTTPQLGGIHAMGEYNGQLLIAGQFFVNNNFINVLQWDLDTSQWQALGEPGTFGTYSVKSLVVYNNQLIAGGDFFIVNDQSANGLAQWNQATRQWERFEPGPSSSHVYDLDIHDGDLIVAGGFVSAGGVPSRGIARWNPIDGWRGMAGGVSQHVNAITHHNGDLIIAGYFTSAGGSPANNIARWNDASQTWEPVGQGVTNCCGYGASVYATASAHGILYAGGWFGFGEDGPQRIIGWQNCNLPCPGDIAGNDGQVNVNDLLAVINAWGACPAPPATCAADITGDTQVNVNDLLAVINAWGACPTS